jgi:hypothetical protein
LPINHQGKEAGEVKFHAIFDKINKSIINKIAFERKLIKGIQASYD